MKHKVASVEDLPNYDAYDDSSSPVTTTWKSGMQMYYSACVLANVVLSWDAQVVENLWSDIDLTAWDDYGAFRKRCDVPLDDNILLRRLKAVVEQFPHDEEIASRVQRFESACNSLAAHHCKNVFKIRETWAIVYPTKACTIRRATSAEILNDSKSFDSQVDSQEHLLLSDQVAACAAADAAGFHWTYREPELSTRCKEDLSRKRR